MFSKACEYGIKAVIYIATQSMNNNRVKIGNIVDHIGSPEAFTAKVLGALTKHDIVKSYTGPYGGFEIETRRMEAIKLSEIVFAIDGDSIYKGCGLGLNECNSDQPCPIHDRFVHIREELRKMIETTSIHDLAADLKAGQSILNR